ncbi:DUF6121 family protein [Marisediminicola antarctica]|uniref:Uncharacterized protein n=1 Tax=Marisediminicola antarctica TaxID=674079 RepID=A0A7L5AGC3_9MICO|nr:DUF6121 family protein [Marisediminicola antarctica]QHO69026.1 hypothetical protein BHD05_04580 [Marisediminicola antarctica]
MTAPTQPDPPSRGLLALGATVLAVALLVFVGGFLSLFLDRDLVELPDAGTLVGPVMAVATCGVVFSFVFRRMPLGLGLRALSASLWTLIASPAVGAILYSIVRENLAVIPVFFGTYLLSPFVLSSAVIAGVVVGLAGLAERARPVE